MKISFEQREEMWAAAGSSGHQCRDCGEVFRSLGAFDRHRAGPMRNRTCLRPDEIGMHKVANKWASEWDRKCRFQPTVIEN